MQLDIIEQLRQERRRIAGHLDKLDAALAALIGDGPRMKHNRASITAPVVAKKRRMSAATKAKISKAMKARHAGIKAKK